MHTSRMKVAAIVSAALVAAGCAEGVKQEAKVTAPSAAAQSQPPAVETTEPAPSGPIQATLGKPFYWKSQASSGAITVTKVGSAKTLGSQDGLLDTAKNGYLNGFKISIVVSRGTEPVNPFYFRVRGDDGQVYDYGLVYNAPWGQPLQSEELSAGQSVTGVVILDSPAHGTLEWTSVMGTSEIVWKF